MCCDPDGNSATPKSRTCQESKEKTYNEAKAICLAEGRRLCTQKEFPSEGVRGCYFTWYLMWSDKPCQTRNFDPSKISGGSDGSLATRSDNADNSTSIFSRISAGVIVGIACGVVLVVVVLILFCTCRGRKNGKNGESNGLRDSTSDVLPVTEPATAIQSPRVSIVQKLPQLLSMSSIEKMFSRDDVAAPSVDVPQEVGTPQKQSLFKLKINALRKSSIN